MYRRKLSAVIGRIFEKFRLFKKTELLVYRSSDDPSYVRVVEQQRRSGTIDKPERSMTRASKFFEHRGSNFN